MQNHCPRFSGNGLLRPRCRLAVVLLLLLLLLFHDHITAGVDHVVVLWRRSRHVDDTLLPELHLLYALRREKPGFIRSPHESFQQAAIRRTDHLDHVPGLDLDVPGQTTVVALHADHGRAGVANRAGCTVRVGADAGRIADDVARVAKAFI